MFTAVVSEERRNARAKVSRNPGDLRSNGVELWGESVSGKALTAGAFRSFSG
jgi:hypothetical protein